MGQLIDLAAARAARDERRRRMTVTLHVSPDALLEPWLLGIEVWRSCARVWLTVGLVLLDGSDGR